MDRKRHRLPPLNFISGFEAAARNLSFTKAARELFITQSAISKQVKALEESLGVALFERRTRELALTAEGQQLYRTATELLDWLQEESDKLRAGGKAQQISVTASPGFTSLWLIPRLKRFRMTHPDIDVRISATVDILQLERKRLDVAIRYCRPDAAPKGAVRLFDYSAFPVCSPALMRDCSKPLVKPEDLGAHVLLHDTYTTSQRAYVDWESWFATVGLTDLQPAGALYFNHYDQMIQAAIQGQGVALGISSLVHELLQDGLLVAPFSTPVVDTRACFIVTSPLAVGKPQVEAFVHWLLDEAKRDAESEAPACVRPEARADRGTAVRSRPG
jgi:LysR family transcriptional regulator, glycine cleavage system transcriptional activator